MPRFKQTESHNDNLKPNLQVVSSTFPQLVCQLVVPSVKSHNRQSDKADTGDEASHFLKQLLSALQNKDILAAIGNAVGEAIRPAIRDEINILVVKNKELENEIVSLKETIGEKDRVINNLSDSLDRLEQHSRGNNIRVMGLPGTEGENTDQLIVDLAQTIGVKMPMEDIDISHRVPRFPHKPQAQSRPIIVRLSNNNIKRALIKSRAQVKEHRARNNTKIFINEDLTRKRAILARRC